jgi:hypothetical protein
MLAVILAIHVWFGTYSVLDVGEPGVPQLSTLQMRWLHPHPCSSRISASVALLALCQTATVEVPVGSSVGRIRAQEIDRKSETDVNAAYSWFSRNWRELCSATYSPARRMYVGETCAACSPDQILPSVPGESSVLSRSVSRTKRKEVASADPRKADLRT